MIKKTKIIPSSLGFDKLLPGYQLTAAQPAFQMRRGRLGRRQRTVCTYTVKLCIFHSFKSNFVSCEDRCCCQMSAIRNAAASFTSFLLDSLRNCRRSSFQVSFLWWILLDPNVTCSPAPGTLGPTLPKQDWCQKGSLVISTEWVLRLTESMCWWQYLSFVQTFPAGLMCLTGWMEPSMCLCRAAYERTTGF